MTENTLTPKRVLLCFKTPHTTSSCSCSINEAETALSLVLIISDLAALFALRKLGCVMGDKERMAASEAALLKQVRLGGIGVI